MPEIKDLYIYTTKLAYCNITANGSSLQRSLIRADTQSLCYIQLKVEESHAQPNTQ